MNLERNNLDRARSPYLRQHTDNPVWWQEWTTDVLDYAARAGKPLFVSVGYATCHWCHVMAAEAFSDGSVAAYLNRHFVSIKIDREERPDIDHYLMQFLLATRGNGGWPLNVFLATPQRPVAALTYVPVQARGGMPGFVEIAERVVAFIAERRDGLRDFVLPGPHAADATPEAPAASADEGASGAARLDVSYVAEGANRAVGDAARAKAANLLQRADAEYGGFGTTAKFPPHATLLFLMHASPDDPAVDRVVHHALHAMALMGLHDHLQGGFFRYCVDRAWTIPHFEKMLYDQAMLLWVYAVAAQRYGHPLYRYVAERIVTALDETFATGPLFVSAHDADTDHVEGATYVWSDGELAAATSVEEDSADDTDRAEERVPDAVTRLFWLTPGGNFEGRHHLIRHPGTSAPTSAERAVIDRLLAIRRTRRQPEIDRKVVTAWNALAGVAFVVAGRALGRSEWVGRAYSIRDALLTVNGDVRGAAPLSISLVRSSLDGDRSHGEFLEDYAAMLLLETYLMEIDAPSPHPGASSAEEAPGDAARDGARRDGDPPAPSSETLAALRAGVLRFYHAGGDGEAGRNASDEDRRDEGRGGDADADGGRAGAGAGAASVAPSPAGWFMSATGDFPPVPADEFDAPTPSGISLAELALLRAAHLTGTPVAATRGAPPIDGGALPVGAEQVRDFHNIAALFSAGEIPVLHRRTPLPWADLPPGAMQIAATHDDWCFRGVCTAGDPPSAGRAT